ncbi:hypothetical protein PPL_01253 [Heterostelium album PN500]|uniref:Trafficking protein particle complex subunit n=1 Tax=Heterostelium pallidum (strain ATCC 26659 / Pp 5 / PN500) TaxID=670386 RepID=D3AYJ3_HETP5|nr:hypothetical protein PPL_01253 [Heterostelium album PN500]EFA86020.1 hypothetical protein PPL_01253 [Heterostelium album PN500]|eukprot:XP_020438126.1 hypothetical protein PPL_01253 [Heterostelium album PN500]
MIFNIFIFNKSGTCIYYEEWNRKKASPNLQEEQKLLFGMLYSLKSCLSKLSPSPYVYLIFTLLLHYIINPQSNSMDPQTGFHCLTTSTYKLHFYETLSCVKFIVLTDPKTPDLREDLKKIYNSAFVEYVIKNPLYQLNSVIKCELFITQLNQIIKAIPYFNNQEK